MVGASECVGRRGWDYSLRNALRAAERDWRLFRVGAHRSPTELSRSTVFPMWKSVARSLFTNSSHRRGVLTGAPSWGRTE